MEGICPPFAVKQEGAILKGIFFRERVICPYRLLCLLGPSVRIVVAPWVS